MILTVEWKWNIKSYYKGMGRYSNAILMMILMKILMIFIYHENLRYCPWTTIINVYIYKNKKFRWISE